MTPKSIAPKIIRPVSDRTPTPALLLGPLMRVRCHFVKEAGGNIPCQHEECRWCHMPTYFRWYGPALTCGAAVDSDGRRFLRLPAIAEISDELFRESSLDEREHRGLLLQMYKSPRGFSLEIVKQLDSELRPPFDVRPHLERILRFPIPLEDASAEGLPEDAIAGSINDRPAPFDLSRWAVMPEKDRQAIIGEIMRLPEPQRSAMLNEVNLRRAAR